MPRARTLRPLRRVSRLTRLGASAGKTHRKGTRAAQLETYLREVAGQMNLADWDVCFEDKEPRAECEAEVTQSEDQHAHIRVAPRFWSHTRDFQRLVLVHELTHLAFTGGDAFAGALAAVAPGPAGDAISAIMYANEEHVVEWATRLLAPTLPLPPKFVAR